MAHDEGREAKAKDYADVINKDKSFMYNDPVKYDAFLAGWDACGEQLAKERKLRKELVASVEDLIGRESFKLNYPRTAEKLEALIKKGT